MDYNVETIFSFENSKGTNVIGRMTVPFVNGVAYKPGNITILSGTLDVEYRALEGASSKSIREKKSDIIEKYCIEKGMKAFIDKPFFINGGKSTGIVALIGILNGYNSNNKGKIYFVNNSLKNMKLGMLFQNLGSTKIKPSDFINLDEAIDKYDLYFRQLKANYFRNKKTSSTDEIRSKND